MTAATSSRVSAQSHTHRPIPLRYVPSPLTATCTAARAAGKSPHDPLKVTLNLKLITKIGLSHWCRVKATLHVGPKDYMNYPDRLEEQELARQEHLSSMAAKPWDEVRPDSIVPQRWDQKLPPAPWPVSQSQTGACAAGTSSSHMHMSE